MRWRVRFLFHDIIANEDRHLNNFGVIRNAETLEWLGFAPIYDSGSSLGYDKTPGQIRSGKEVVCKPFKNHHAEQLKLVSDFSWINFDRLTAVKELITSVLTIDGAEEYMDDKAGTVFSDCTGHLTIRCRKCKTVSVLNLAYFRRHRRRRYEKNN